MLATPLPFLLLILLLLLLRIFVRHEPHASNVRPHTSIRARRAVRLLTEFRNPSTIRKGLRNRKKRLRDRELS